MKQKSRCRLMPIALSSLLLASACSGSEDTAPPIETTPDEAIPAVIDDGSGGVVVADPLVLDQWAIEGANINSAWMVASGEGVVIAIVDSGVDLTHPDLVDSLVPGWDFIDDDDQPDDENGHGTHVAGIAAATTNSIGVAGAAPKASIMPIRVLDAQGSGSDDTISEGITWAVDHGADVINLSLGESGALSRLTRGSSLNRAIRYASGNGVVVVAASGNEGTAGQQYRIGVDVLVVNATNAEGVLTEFSNVGDLRAVSAPGMDILSTSPTEPSTIWPEGTDGYSSLDGTSMATPLVSGVAALLISHGVPADQIIDRLTATASNPDNDPLLGAGIIDAGAALDIASPNTDEDDSEVDEEETASTTTEVTEPTTIPEEETTTAPPTTAAPETTVTTPATTATVPDVPVGQGAGSLTLVITAPVSCSATVDADVICTVTGVRYNASVGTTDLGHGYSASANVSILGYSGPGNYPAAGLVHVSTPAGEFPVPLVGSANIQEDLGGSVDAVTEGFDGYLAWECGN